MDANSNEGNEQQAIAQGAVATLVASQREFLAFLERRVGDGALAEDILQAAFVRGIEKIGQLREGESVVAWFYRMLRNAVIDHHRRSGAADRGLQGFARELQTLDAPTPDLHDSICRCVAGLVETLKPEYAEAIRRVELEGVAVKAFAEQAAITPNNAAVRVFRAREALRKQVVRCCGSCAEHGCVDCSCHAS